MSRFARKSIVVAVLLALLGFTVACGSDDEAASDTTEAAAETTVAEPADDTEPAADTTDPAEPGEVVVAALDYRFEGLPESVPSGTKLTLDNQSEEVLHELVVIRIPDEETRPVSELVTLPEEETDAIFGGAPPALVALQAPGGEVIPAVGDGVVTEPGRYAAVCFIPLGVTPEEYLVAAEAATDGPPDLPNAGPPHVTEGMFAEFTVE